MPSPKRQKRTPAATGFAEAEKHLSRRDPILKKLIASVGPCTLQPNPDGFHILTRSIVSQLISTKAAITIYTRLQAALGGTVLPDTLLAATEEALRGVGLSRAKARGLRDLAERVQTEVLPLAHLPGMTDEEVMAHLLPVHGIGRWTAEMFLIFSLGRLDVLPVADLGLRAGVQDVYGLAEMPTAADLRERAAPWQPYRSIATWYFWRSRGGVPQSK